MGGEGAGVGSLPEEAQQIVLERAAAGLLANVARHGRIVTIAAPGSEELRFLNAMDAEASAGGPGSLHILLRANPGKAAVLEEFLHGTQVRLGVPQRLTLAGLEMHVKDFMIRHRKLLGLGDDDVAVLRMLLMQDMEWLMRGG